MSIIETQEHVPSQSASSIFSRFLLWLTEPHPKVAEIGDRRRAQLLAGISLVLVFPLLFGIILRLITNDPEDWLSAATFEFVGLVLFSLLAYILSRTQYFQLGSYTLVTAFSMGAIINSFDSGNVSGALYFIIPAFVVGSALLRPREITVLVVIDVAILFLLPAFSPTIIQSFAETGIVLTTGLLIIIVVAVRNLIERERLAEVETVNRALRSLQSSLEQRVADATRDLELAAEVSQKVSMVHDVDTMLAQAVDRIRDRFDLYHTQVYITDPTERTLVLRAGTGEVGQTLLNRGHRLPIDMSSVNGIAATERRPVIVEDTETNPLHRTNPLLPDTRSEMVVPLLIGQIVVGILDMQSRQPRALSDENLTAFEALAGQLAISVTNAELFTEIEQAQALVEEQTRRLTREGWHDFMDAIERSERIAYTYDRENITPLQTPINEVQEEDTLITPIRVTGVEIGKMHFQRDEAWTEDDYVTTSAVAQQVAQQIENLRLLAQAEQYQAEAQEALQRQTRQGWEGYQEQLATQAGFVYHNHEVKSVNGNGFEEALKYEIKVRDEPIGELAIAGLNTLSEEDSEMVTFINEQLSEHLENLRLSTQTEQALSETEDQARRLAALNALSEQLATAHSFEDVFKVAGQFLPMIVATDQISTTRVDESGDTLEVFALQSMEGAIPTGMQLPIAGSAVGEAIRQRRPINIPDLRIEEYLESKPLLEQGLLSTLVVPLLVSGQAIGTLNFGSSDANFYTEPKRDLAVQAASLIGSTIENRQLFYRVQEALAETEAMLEITSVASSSLELETTLAQVMTKVLETTVASSGLISVYNKQTQRLELVSHDLPEPLLRKLQANGLEGTLCDLVYQCKEILLLEDLKIESPIDATGLINMGFHAYQGVPLTFKDNVMGTLCVFYRQEITAQDADTALMKVVGQQIGVAIENTNLFEQTQKRAEELDILNEMGRTLVSLQDEQAIYETIFEYTDRLMDAETFFVAIYNKERHEIEMPLLYENGQMDRMPNIPAGNGLTNYIIQTRKPMLISTNFSERLKELNIEEVVFGDTSPVTSWIGVPLIFQDHIIGIVSVQSNTTPGLYTEHERDLLIAIASQATLALENANAFRQTQQQAEQEATINLISQRIQSTTSVENALQVAIRELGRALGAKRTNVQLGLPDQQEKLKSGNGFHPGK